MSNQYIEKILRARVYDIAVETPLEYAALLSCRLGNAVYLKREDLQPVFSFKLRGAYNKMALIDDKARAQGVIAASAGNHAQGVALSAEKLNIDALIVMPTTTPEIKVNSVQRRGARIVLHGDSYDDAYQHALILAGEKNLTFIHPYDDPDVIAGQGTIADEILRQIRTDIHAIFVPVGGGGLIAGIAAYVKFVRPEIKIIGVESEDSDCLNRALKAGRRVILKKVGIFADGVAVKQIGKEPFRIAHRCVDQVITVNTDEICAAIKDIFDDTRAIAEPAGALAVAGIKKYVDEHPSLRDQNLIAIESGANINFDRLRYVAERAEVGDHREVLFAVTIPEQSGSFLKFCSTLGKRNITEFNYRFFDQQDAQIFVGLAAGGDEQRKQLLESIQADGFPVIDMTENELAKEHMRYMVGGHAPYLLNERIYRLQFPERPGALLQFLSALGSRWNISLFHYRNHGAAFGKVLMGIQVPLAERKILIQCLETLGFDYVEETRNPAYKIFAGGAECN